MYLNLYLTCIKFRAVLEFAQTLGARNQD